MLCGFAGSPSHFRRVQMVNIMKGHPDLFDTSIFTYEQDDPTHPDVRWSTPNLQYVEQSERWKCIIDIRG